MFTGIVEELGYVRDLRRAGNGLQLTIGATKVTGDLGIGDSVAVSGVCLTVVRVAPHSFVCDVMPETLRVTVLGELKPGDAVNLERSLRLGDRLGGHMVSGHIDGVGTILRREPIGNALIFDIAAPAAVMKYIAPKGSVAVDGVSLTVVDRLKEGFRVSIIPHTAAVTTLGIKGAGARVNLEADLVARYLELLVKAYVRGHEGEKAISMEFLREHGYV